MSREARRAHPSTLVHRLADRTRYQSTHKRARASRLCTRGRRRRSDALDTAHSYAGGESERTIGAALSPLREGIVVATKGGLQPGEGRPGLLRAQIEESLRRLQTETIDLYYLHRVDPETPLAESLRSIADYRDAGKIRDVGLSEVGIREIEQAREIVPVAAVQNHYSLNERGWDDVVDYCTREEITFVPFFPLRGVSGKALAEIAKRHGATTAQIALAWLLRRSPVMLPIPGTLMLDHLRQNLAANKIELSDADSDALSDCDSGSQK